MSKLTKQLVARTLACATRETVVWDAALPRFGLRVRPGAAAVYVVKFRNRYGRQRKLTLGEAALLSLDQARDAARTVLAEVDLGGDPLDRRVADRQAITVAEVCDRFIAHHVDPKTKPRTARDYRSIIERRIKPALERLPFNTVSRLDVTELHLSLAAIPRQANYTLAVLSKMFTWAIVHGLRADGVNPCRHVSRYRERLRSRFLTPAEFAALGIALQGADDTGAISRAAANAIRLLVLTGARVSEVLGLRWIDVDLERCALRLPDSKTGPKVIFLSRPAVDLLASMPRAEESPYVIQGRRRGRPMVNIAKPWGIVRRRAGLPGVRLHDLRHSFASVAAAAGVSLPIIGGLLGHTQPQTTARYAHLAAEPLRAANELIGQRIAAVIALPVYPARTGHS